MTNKRNRNKPVELIMLHSQKRKTLAKLAIKAFNNAITSGNHYAITKECR